MRPVAAALGRAGVAFVVLVPLTLLTLIIVGGGESAAAFLVGAFCVIALVTCAAIGRRAWRPLVVVAVVAVAHFFVLASTFAPVQVDSERELRAAHHGYPVAWVTVEHYWDPPTYPRTYGWNPWEEPATADDGRYAASLGLVLAPLLVLVRGVDLVVRKRERGRAGNRAPGWSS